MKVGNLVKLVAIAGFITTLAVASNSFAQTTFYVNNQIGSDGRNGLAPTIPSPDDGITGPKLTVKNAIAAAVNGDIISVANTGITYGEAALTGGNAIQKVLTFTSTGGTPFFANAWEINEVAPGNVTFTGPFQNSNGLILTQGTVDGGTFLFISNQVTRSDIAFLNGQLNYIGQVDFTYNLTGVNDPLTTGDEFPQTGSTNVVRNLTTNGAGLTLRLEETKTINGVLTTAGPLNLNNSTLYIVGASTAHRVGGDVTLGTLAFDLTGNAEIDGTGSPNLANVSADKTLAGVATLTIEGGAVNPINDVDNIRASGYASINANNVGDIDDVENNGFGTITTANDGNTNNVTNTSSGTITLGVGAAGPHRVTGNIVQSGTGLIQYDLGPPTATAVNVTGDVILSTPLAMTDAGGPYTNNGRILFNLDVPVDIDGTLFNSFDLSGTNDDAGNTGNGVIIFSPTTNTVDVGGVTLDATNNASLTAPGTITGNALISFANTTGALTIGPVTNSAIWNNGSASNNGNARIAGTAGAGQTYTINFGAVTNSSSTADGFTNCDIDFSNTINPYTLASISTGSPAGGDILFGNGNANITGSVTNSRSAAGADITIGNAAGGQTLTVGGSVTNSGASNINFGGQTGNAAISGSLTQSGSGTTTFELTTGNFSCNGMDVSNGTVSFDLMTSGNINTGAGALTVRGGTLSRYTAPAGYSGDVTSTQFTLEGGTVKLKGDGANSFFVTGIASLKSGWLYLDNMLELRFSGSSITLGGRNTNPFFLGEDTKPTRMVFDQPIPNVLQTIRIGNQIPTWKGPLDLINPANLAEVIRIVGGHFRIAGNNTVTINNASVNNSTTLDSAKILIGQNDPLGSGGTFVNTTGYKTVNDGRIVMQGNAAQQVTFGASARFGGFEVDNNGGTAAPNADVFFTTQNTNETNAVFTDFFYLAEGTVEGQDVEFDNTTTYPTIVRNEGTFDAAPTFTSMVNVSYIGGVNHTVSVELPTAVDKLNNLTVATTNSPTQAGRATVTLLGNTTVNGVLEVRNGQGLHIPTGLTLTMNGPTMDLKTNGIIGNTGNGVLLLSRTTGTAITGGVGSALPPINVAANSTGNSITDVDALVHDYFGGDGVFGQPLPVPPNTPNEDATPDGDLAFLGTPGSGSLTANFNQNFDAVPALIPDLNDMTVNSTLFLANNLYMSGNLVMNSGTINVGTYTLYVDGTNNTIDGASATVTGLGKLLWQGAAAGLNTLNIPTADATLDVGTYEIAIGVGNRFEITTNDLILASSVLVTSGQMWLGTNAPVARDITITGNALTLTANSSVNGNGILTLNPSAPPLIFTFTGTPSITNLTQLGDVTLAGTGAGLTINGVYLHNGGELNYATRTITTSGTFTHAAGTYTASSGYFVFSGATFNNNADFSIPNFRYSAGNVGFTSTGHMTVTNNMHYNGGTFTVDKDPGTPVVSGFTLGDGTNPINVNYTSGNVTPQPVFASTMNLLLTNTAVLTLPVNVWPTSEIVGTLTTNNTAAISMQPGTRQIGATTYNHNAGTFTLPNQPAAAPSVLTLLGTAPFNMNAGTFNVNGNAAVNMGDNSQLNLNGGTIQGTGTFNYGDGQNVRVNAGVMNATVIGPANNNSNITYAVDAAYGTANELPPVVNNLWFTRTTNVINSVTTINSTVRVNGALSISNNVTTLAANTFSVAGDVTIATEPNPLFTLATPPVCTFGAPLSFVGGSDQNITVLPAGQAVGSITINKGNATNKVNLLGGNLAINPGGTLFLVNGLLVTNGNVLTLQAPVPQPAPPAGVPQQGFSRAGVVAGNVSHVVGNVRKVLVNTGAYATSTYERSEFPVGTLEEYRPVAITFRYDPGLIPTIPAGLQLTVSHVDDPPTGTVGLPIADGVEPGIDILSYPNFYWQIVANQDVGQREFDLEMRADGFEDYFSVANLRTIRRHGGILDVDNEWRRQGNWYDYDNALYEGDPTKPIVINENSLGGLRTDGALFTYGLQSGIIPGQEHFQTVWEGNPFMAMTIFCTEAKIGGVDVVAGDEIGVFDGSLCVGAVVLDQTPTQANPAQIICSKREDELNNGFTDGHDIDFRLWDQTTSTEYNASAQFIDPNTGVDVAPVPFQELSTAAAKLADAGLSSETQSVDFYTGWNIFSTAVTPSGSHDMLDVLNPIQANLVKVIDEAGNSLVKLFGIWQNSIGDWAATEGYYVKVDQNVTLDITGTVIPTPLWIPFTDGWNIMSYPCYSSEQNALSIFQPLIDADQLVKVIDEAGNSVVKLFGIWQNSIGNLRPGEGYYVKVNADCQLRVGCTGLAKTVTLEPPAEELKHFSLGWEGHPFEPMNIFVADARIDESHLAPGDEIAVFAGEQCVGATVVAQDLSLAEPLELIAAKDDGSGQGFAEGSPISFKIWRSDADEEIKLEPESIRYLNVETGDETTAATFEGLGTTVVSISFVTPQEVEVPETYKLDQNYPNPFNPTTRITYALPEESHVKIVVFALNGKLVKTLHDGRQSVGFHSIGWDGTDAFGNKVATGVYFYKLTAGTFSDTKKMIFTK